MELLPIRISDYDYALPDDRIARFPLEDRAASKLLVWENGAIAHEQFLNLPDLIPPETVMVFNNTRVIPARLYFRKETGGLIEIFLLSPVDPPVVDMAMHAGSGGRWACAIGNLKKWPDGVALERTVLLEDGLGLVLRASLHDRIRQEVVFEWDSADTPFVKIVEACGQSPIPPYLNRKAEDSDKIRYQTVYGKREGAVAAPTAGLHFTTEILEALDAKGIVREELTLHVSAGTFRPVKAENALEHPMHAEQVVVRRSTILALCSGRKVAAVGTTSLRTLESLYWYGVQLIQQPEADFFIEKLAPYKDEGLLPDKTQAMQAILARMDHLGLEELHGSTEIYIFPAYRFRVVDMLVTNFHQPASTLLLLVSAFTGGKHWKKIYQSALDNGYRFLSYGDSSLLFRP